MVYSSKEICRLWLMAVGMCLLLVAVCAVPERCFAQDVPAAAARHRMDLVRAAREAWGLDAPVAALAAQVQQESGWNAEAVSRVGARGMAQFMPDTARWWCERMRTPAEACMPTNAVWSLRALAGYDKWLFDRVRGDSEFDRMWAALRAYNGGLGHWLAEAQCAAAHSRTAVDAACGRASRAAVHCAENLSYPRRILLALQPRYLGWGRGVAT